MSASGTQQLDIGCITTCHETASIAYPFQKDVLLLSSDRERVTPSAELKLRRSGHLSKANAQYRICQACVNYAIIYLETTPTVREEVKQIADDIVNNKCSDEELGMLSSSLSLSVREMVKSIDGGRYSAEDLVPLALSLGRFISNDMDRRAAVAVTEKEDAVLHFHPYGDTWKSGQNVIMKNFLKGVVYYKRFSLDKRKTAKRCLVKSVDSVYSALKTNYISQHALAENLVLYFFGGSKMVCDIFGATQSSGGYRTILNLSKALSINPPPPPSSDCYFAFDNIQRVGKQYGVTYQGKQPISVVTAVSAFYETQSTNYQCMYDVPNVYDPAFTDSGKIMQAVQKLKQQVSEVHGSYGTSFVSARLERMKSEVKEVRQLPSHENKQTVKKYEDSGFGLSYNRVPRSPSQANVKDMECLNVNPNSEKTILNVLEYILKLSDAGNPNRKWVVCVCDGLPFTVAVNLIRSTYHCSHCKVDMKREEVNAHTRLQEHQDAGAAFPEMKFRKLVMRPGNGHYEINFVRAIFKLFFESFIQPVAEMVGFKTPKALAFCKRAVDHHKSIMILQILFEALVDELLTPYIEECESSGIEATAEDYFSWASKAKNPNYHLASSFAFGILHPLFLFRAAIRQCNEEVALIAREKLSAIFYGGNHPKYREINAYDVAYLMGVVEAASKLIRAQSIRMEGSQHGQGIDFQQEERNAIILSWVHATGVPSFEQWKRATGSVNRLEKIRQDVLNELSLNSRGRSEKTINHSEVIFRARIFIRSLNLLGAEEQPLVSFTDKKEPLDSELVNFLKRCEENREAYYKAFFKGEKVTLETITFRDYLTFSDKELKSRIKIRLKKLPEFVSNHYSHFMKEGLSLPELREMYCFLEEEMFLYKSKVASEFATLQNVMNLQQD